jgi:hypothetical protein
MANTNEIKVGSWIYTTTQFGTKVYKVLSVKTFGKGVEVGTSFGTATFSLFLGADNWRFAVQSDIK